VEQDVRILRSQFHDYGGSDRMRRLVGVLGVGVYNSSTRNLNTERDICILLTLLTSDSDEAVSSDSESELDEDTVAADDKNNVTEAEVTFGQDSNMNGVLVVPILSL
jgi:hypothetical protein